MVVRRTIREYLRDNPGASKDKIYDQLINALMREIKEELGIRISESDILKKHTFPFINYHIFEIHLKENPKKENLKEGKNMKFMAKKEFLKTKNALLRVKIFLKVFKIN